MSRILWIFTLVSLFVFPLAELAEAGAFDRVKRMFGSRERVTLEGTIINVDSQGPVFRSESGSAFRLTGNQATALQDKTGAEVSITGYHKGDNFDLRRFKILREAIPEPVAEPEPSIYDDDDDYDDYPSVTTSPQPVREERWSDDDYDDYSSSSSAQTYVVAPGDTLGKISSQFYGSAAHWGKIAKENNISDPRRINVGTRLTIPPK